MCKNTQFSCALKFCLFVLLSVATIPTNSIDISIEIDIGSSPPAPPEPVPASATNAKSGLTNTPKIAAVDFNEFRLCPPTLSNFIDQLPDLAIFHANSNNFSGTIPDMRNLTFLYELDLTSNAFSGAFPSCFNPGFLNCSVHSFPLFSTASFYPRLQNNGHGHRTHNQSRFWFRTNLSYLQPYYTCLSATTLLNVTASLLKTTLIIAHTADPLLQKQSSESDQRTSSSSFPLHSRESLYDSDHADYKSLTLSRLSRDASRVKAINARLQLAVNGVRKSDLKPLLTEGAEYLTKVTLQEPIISRTSQNSSEYFSGLNVGTPLKPMYMVLDTGSDLTWIRCEPCSDCYQQSDPVFSPSASSTYAPVSCDAQACQSLDVHACPNNSCLYQVSYGDASYIVENFATESNSCITNLKTTFLCLSTNIAPFLPKIFIGTITIDNEILFDNIDIFFFVLPNLCIEATVRSSFHSSLFVINHILVLFLFDKLNFAPYKSISISRYTFTLSSLIAQLSDNRHQVIHYHLQNANAGILSSPHIALVFTSKTSFDNTVFNFTRDKYSHFVTIGSIYDLEDKVDFESVGMIGCQYGQ